MNVCRKTRMSHHTRKGKGKVRTTPMEEDQTLKVNQIRDTTKWMNKATSRCFKDLYGVNVNNANQD